MKDGFKLARYTGLEEEATVRKTGVEIAQQLYKVPVTPDVLQKFIKACPKLVTFFEAKGFVTDEFMDSLNLPRADPSNDNSSRNQEDLALHRQRCVILNEDVSRVQRTKEREKWTAARLKEQRDANKPILDQHKKAMKDFDGNIGDLTKRVAGKKAKGLTQFGDCVINVGRYRETCRVAFVDIQRSVRELEALQASNSKIQQEFKEHSGRGDVAKAEPLLARVETLVIEAEKIEKEVNRHAGTIQKYYDAPPSEGDEAMSSEQKQKRRKVMKGREITWLALKPSTTLAEKKKLKDNIAKLELDLQDQKALLDASE